MSLRMDEIAKQMGTKPTENMAIVLDKLGTESGNVPSVDKYYTFVYTPKTPNIQYDQHPFILCSSVHKWGFCGINMHWDDYRRYTWAEMGTPLYEILDDEVQQFSGFPIMLVKQS